MSPADQQDLAPAEIRAQLDQVLASAEFGRSQQMQDFLRFVVTETLAGRADRLKQYTIATNVFGRSSDFDPQNDPVVRMLAGKIRRSLHRYYLEEGIEATIKIEIPKGAYIPRFERREPSETSPDRRSVRTVSNPIMAVLPFFDYSTDTSKPFLAESISDEIATELARFKYLRVVSYYSSRQFKNSGRPASEIGHELGCDYLLTGSFNLGQEALRLNTQLISVSTELQVWSRRWESPYTSDNLSALTDDLIGKVVGRIADNHGVILRYAAKAAAAKQGKEPSLFETILRFQSYAKGLSEQDHQQVLAELQQAVEAAPNYGMAWACLSLMYLDVVLFDFPGVDDAQEKARECIKRALALDSACQQTYFTMATICMMDGDNAGVCRAARRIYELNPGAAYMVGSAGWFLILAGEEEEGLKLMNKALELNPHQPPWFHFAPMLMALRRQDYREAFACAERFEMPEFHWSALCQAAMAGLSGLESKASSAVRALLELKPDIEDRASTLVGYYVLEPELRDLFLSGLEQAGLEVSHTA